MSTHDQIYIKIIFFFRNLLFSLHVWDDSELLLPTSFFSSADGSFSRASAQLFVQADVSFIFVPQIFKLCALYFWRFNGHF